MPQFVAFLPTGNVAQKDREGYGLGERKKQKKNKGKKTMQNVAPAVPVAQVASAQSTTRVTSARYTHTHRHLMPKGFIKCFLIKPSMCLISKKTH